MTLSAVIPILEGKLYAWGLSQTSATPYFQQDAAFVESILKKANAEQRRLIELRYKKRWQWWQVAQALHVSERTVFSMRDRILKLLADGYGLSAQLQLHCRSCSAPLC